jgi:hypothetical protein
MRYNSTTLYQYCETNNIILKQNYNDVNINRENYIEGKCLTLNCLDIFNKNFRQLVKTGAYCEKCMKKIASDKIKNKKVKYDKNNLIDFCNANKINIDDMCLNNFINRNSIIVGKCLTIDCKNSFSKTFRQLLNLNGFCSDCCKENGKIKIKNTNLNKYGVECCLLSKEIQSKRKHTIMEKYGVEFVSQNETIKQNMKLKNMEKYGVEHVLQIPEMRERIINTNLKKYGVENPQQNKEIKEKTKQTNLEKYGAENYFATKEFQEQIKKNNLDKYGVEHHSQNPEIAEKMQKTSFRLKQYTMPSGKVIGYQGYENFAYDELINVEKIDEEDLITNRKDVPEIWYLDSVCVRRRHYVDIYIKSQNRCVEVKSTWTANNKNNNIFEKQSAAISENYGYKYEIWIYDKDGNKILTY